MGFRYTISDEESGVSPKGFLKKLLDMPYRRLQQAIRKGDILVNDEMIPDNYQLRTGDILHSEQPQLVMREKGNGKSPAARDLGCVVLYEDEDFLVLNKAPAIVVQGAQGHDTSITLHLRFLENERGIPPGTFHQTHRLDKETTGTLLIGKHQKSIRELNALFRNQEVKKRYHTICVGEVLESGTIKEPLQRNEEGAKEKVGITENGKVCITHYRPIEWYTYAELDLTLLEVVIETGFMHQIRAHLKYAGFPILGDAMYGHLFANRKLGTLISRQCLHATSLSFRYQETEQHIEAPFWDDMQALIKTLSSR